MKKFFRNLLMAAAILAVTPGIVAGWYHGALAATAWLANGNQLYYLLGNVGIGTATPGPTGTGGLAINSTDPQIGDDATNRRALDVSSTAPITGLTPAFSNSFAGTMSVSPTNGDNSFGDPNCDFPASCAKSTFGVLNLTSNAQAAGQRFVLNQLQNCYGEGDCFLGSKRVSFAGADIAGDEGQGFTPQDVLTQQNVLVLQTVSSVARSTYSSTITQDITGSKDVQIVTVASTTNATVGDWIVVGQAVATGAPNIEAVQITAVGSGNISAIFRNNQASGTTLTPALALTLNDGGLFGQGRLLVNLSGASYSTGTVSGVTGAAVLTGSGTTWTVNMVGGSALNIGAFAFDADDYSGAPFNGSGSSGTLKSWYEITSRTSNTQISLHSFSVAGDLAYNGLGPGSGGYVIRPAVRILQISGGRILICETTTSTWTAGDNVEVAITPYPDVTLEQTNIAVWTPGGTYRNGKVIKNNGARKFTNGILLTSQLATGSNAATRAFGTGLDILAPVETGLFIHDASTTAITLNSAEGSGAPAPGSVSDTAGKIFWTNTSASLAPNSTNHGFDWYMCLSGNGCQLQTKSNAAIGSGSIASLNFSGALGTTAGPFADLPTCASDTEGLEKSVTDSNTATWGATVANGGSNHILARCNASNWTVVGK
jgi:hypothetical protein